MDNLDNINNLCRVCLTSRPQPEMLSVNRSQMEKLSFIGDSNKMIRFNGQSPMLCIECGGGLDSVYDFIMRLRTNTLAVKQREATRCDESPHHFIKCEVEPSQSHELILSYESTVQNAVVECKTEPKLEILRRETIVPFDSTVVIHCPIEPDFTECESLRLQLESNHKVKSEPDDELSDSFSSTESVSDWSSPFTSRPKKMLRRSAESVDYSKQKHHSGDVSSGSLPLIKPKTVDELNSSLISKKWLDGSDGSVENQNPQLRDTFSGSLPLIKLKTTGELKSKKKRSRTAESIDAANKCKLCNRNFSSASKMLNHVDEYSGPGFACPATKCNFIFTHESNFEKHIKSHSDVNSYSCGPFAGHSTVPTASEVRGENGGQSQVELLRIVN
ncbi:uncharacterized protein LOC119071765 isoform X2 [Bradysia coprophila]|uniref:uncharacterized protein LOC119071765 isoform X2 n=1 Tax=Bradysia coprophila TaxID=38358 RepID=UPI00187D720B|nr:uncharacterized protein LOC119071765 isoform X2 [Bradysia coprophila]